MRTCESIEFHSGLNADSDSGRDLLSFHKLKCALMVVHAAKIALAKAVLVILIHVSIRALLILQSRHPSTL